MVASELTKALVCTFFLYTQCYGSPEQEKVSHAFEYLVQKPQSIQWG